MTFCTIIARNYIAQARVLGRSLAEQHAGGSLRVLVIDDDVGPIDDADEPFSVVRPAELALSRRELHEMAAIYEPVELATALKPRLLSRLLEDDDVVVYLDPDIEIFAQLDELAHLARGSQVVITPHTLRPIPTDGRKPTQQDILLAGVFNLGFIAVSSAMGEFLAWWFERLRRDCLLDLAGGFFVDQKLIDFLPGWQDPAILRDPAYNVAYWNLHERRLDRSDGGYTIDGRPLRFFHYSGFDPRTPAVLSKHGGHVPRVQPSDNPALAAILREYADKLFAAGFEQSTATRYGFSATSAGEPLTPEIRARYRQALLGDEPNVPDPFDPSATDAFSSWHEHVTAPPPVPPPPPTRHGLVRHVAAELARRLS